MFKLMKRHLCVTVMTSLSIIGGLLVLDEILMRLSDKWLSDLK